MMKRWKGFLGLLCVVAAVGVGAGFRAWQAGRVGQMTPAQATAAARGAYQTAVVRRGKLSISVSGSGSVVAAQPLDLAFAVAGTVAAVNVQVGDPVTQGQVLAVLDGLDALQLKVRQQQVALRVAQKTVADLQSQGALALAQAQADLAAAEAAYQQAQHNLHRPGDARCSKAKTESYYAQYLDAWKAAGVWQGYLDSGKTGYGAAYILEKLNPLKKQRDSAYANWKYCEGYTSAEIAASQAADQLAQAQFAQANDRYANLQAHAGVDPAALALAQATLKSAKLQLVVAEKELQGATLVAPADGVVTALNGAAGDRAGTGVFLTLADLQQSQVQVNIDESDLADFAAGCPAQVTFDSLAGQTFNGVVTQVSPALVSVRGVSMVQGRVALEKDTTAAGKELALGLPATVAVTCQQANDVLVISAQAVYRPEGQPPYVYVLNAQGQPEKRAVEVGLTTAASAEIRSGLQEGERVITTPIQGQ